MDIEGICSLVCKKYLQKNNSLNKDLFIKGNKDNHFDNITVYDFIKDIVDISDYDMGILLRLATIYLASESNIKSSSNNFIEKVSSINLKEYVSLLKDKKQVVMPIKYNVITIKTSEKYLHQKSRKVNLKDKNINNYISILDDYCKEAEVLAMAAVQLGIPKRIIYIKNTNLELIDKFQTKTEIEKDYNEHRVLINPVIVKQSGLTEYWEACASCLDNMGHVYRPYKIEVEYYDINKKKHKQTFIGFESTILSHEYDHLNGILHMDIADEVLIMKPEDRKKFRQNHKYNIISKNGDYLSLLNKQK